MENKCIVSQIHIPDYDPQGNLSKDDKKEIVDTNILSLRKLNPDAYIVLVGHGHEPYDSTKDKFSKGIYRDLHPIDGGGTVINMPAQYKSVSLGIQHAKEKGFDYCLKTRGDSIIAKQDIISYCHDIIESEDRMILLTQQTGKELYKFGDCFMYGEIDLLNSIWDTNNPPFHADGLRHTGISFVKHFSGKVPPMPYNPQAILYEDKNWPELLKEYCSFRDIGEIQFCDLRWNYNQMRQNWENNKQQILNLEYDFEEIYWGRSNGWHIFNSMGQVIRHGGMCHWAYTQAEFYK